MCPKASVSPLCPYAKWALCYLGQTQTSTSNLPHPQQVLAKDEAGGSLLAESGCTHRTCLSVYSVLLRQRGRAAVPNTLALLPATCARRVVAHLHPSPVTSGWDAATDSLYEASPEGYEGKTLLQHLKQGWPARDISLFVSFCFHPHGM